MYHSCISNQTQVLQDDDYYHYHNHYYYNYNHSPKSWTLWTKTSTNSALIPYTLKKSSQSFTLVFGLVLKKFRPKTSLPVLRNDLKIVCAKGTYRSGTFGPLFSICSPMYSPICISQKVSAVSLQNTYRPQSKSKSLP